MRLVSYASGSKSALGIRVSEGVLPLADVAAGLPDNLPALLALGFQEGPRRLTLSA